MKDCKGREVRLGDRAKLWNGQYGTVVCSIDHGEYSFPWEIWLSRFFEHLVKRRSLIDGRELPTEAVNVC